MRGNAAPCGFIVMALPTVGKYDVDKWCINFAYFRGAYLYSTVYYFLRVIRIFVYARFYNFYTNKSHFGPCCCISGLCPSLLTVNLEKFCSHLH